MTRTREQLSEGAKAARREYQRRWRAAHPEKCREYQMRHWEKVAKRAREEAAKGAR